MAIRIGDYVVGLPSEFMKAKYLKRWRGKDGRWHYKYATSSTGDRVRAAESGSDSHMRTRGKRRKSAATAAAGSLPPNSEMLSFFKKYGNSVEDVGGIAASDFNDDDMVYDLVQKYGADKAYGILRWAARRSSYYGDGYYSKKELEQNLRDVVDRNS